MARTEEANKRLREAQRAKILNGARKVFARKGWAATMADVAEAAEVSQGLAYRYFANKEAIFRELVENSLQSGLAMMQHILEMPGTPREKLDFLISRVLANKRERIEFYQLIVQAFNNEATPDDICKLLRRQGQTFQNVVRQLIVEGQANGEFAEGDPDQLVMAVIACLDGLSRLALRNPEHFPDTRIILRMLKP
ncbi:TetR/AcrR family transcriptional regulator [Bacillus smithii]|uniref:TetR/AcrR family transcriptional regulator n=1 Tax=Bacillus smithii TaxID=1479 RepID=UPI003D215427